MKPLRSDEIRGNWATALLPIAENDDIDYGRLAEEIDVLIGMGVDGIYSNGTAGEFHNQTEEEFDRVNALLAERCNAAGTPFQIGVSHMSPRLSLERLRRAVALEPGAVQVILPDWLPVKDAEAIAFLNRMGEEARPIGLVLYNPPHAKRALAPEEIGRLAEAAPALVGVKVADGDAAWYRAMARHAGRLSLFVPGHRLATGFALGAHGSYSNMACLHPGAAQRWFERIKSDYEAALELEGRIRQFMDGCIIPLAAQQGFSDPALDKLLAAIGGWANIGTRLRWPYRSVPETEVSRLRPIAERALPEFFPRPCP
ncbi:MAG TPA: dihydrodipicolinate synthase family protein [Sumerlaeia bacterium]|nr:dihydrodipicolinate synthase family protein [Sumerlaeia bacterium]